MNSIKKILFDINKNQKGGTAVIMVILMLAGVLFIVITASEIVTNGLIMGWTQVHSAKSLYAAEAGAERMLWETRTGEYNPKEDENLATGQCFEFSSQDPLDPSNTILGGVDCDNSSAVIFQNFTNEAKIDKIVYELSASEDVGMTFYGSFGQAGRVIEVSYSCVNSCDTTIGCLEEAPLSGALAVVDLTCCGGGACYECEEGKTWNEETEVCE